MTVNPKPTRDRFQVKLPNKTQSEPIYFEAWLITNHRKHWFLK